MREFTDNPENFSNEELPKTRYDSAEANQDFEDDYEIVETEKLESLAYKIGKTIGRLNDLSNRLDHLVNDSIESSKLWKKWSALSSIKRKVYAITVYSSLAIGAFEATLVKIGHDLTKNRYQVTKLEKLDKKKRNTTEYAHEDPLTTHLLNVISGKESFTDEEVKKMTAAYIKNQQKLDGDSVINTEDLNENDLAQVYDTMAKQEAIDNPTFYALDRNYWKSKPIIKEKLSESFGEEFDQKLYDTLWQIEQEAGNPKIRLAYGKSDPRERANYNAEENTMYLYPEDLDGLGQFIAEASHGKQFKENPYYNAHRKLLDSIIVIAKSIYTGKDARTTYDETLYDLPGSVENYAHHVVEPKLRSKIPPRKQEVPKRPKKIGKLKRIK